MPLQAYRSCFVPHDLAAPLKGAAAGPLAGLSAVVKDMYDIAGERTGCGNPEWLATHPPAARNCPPVQKILDAGATIIGKTVCDEFFYSVTGANAHYGTPVNAARARAACRAARRPARPRPAAPACAISRSAAIPAARCACRHPSTASTACGRRMSASSTAASPTWRRPSTCPAGSRRRPACFARSARCCSTTGGVAAKIDRVVVLEDAFAQAEEAGRRSASHAARIHERRSAGDGARQDRAGWVRSLARGVPNSCRPTRPGRPSAISSQRRSRRSAPACGSALQFASTVTKAQADDCREIVEQGTRAYPANRRARHDPGAADRAEHRAQDRDVSRRVGRFPHTRDAAHLHRRACSGLPQMNIPAGTIDGCPIGLSFIGWAGGDEALLDLACELSRHCGMAA